jgi:hypothetical protein
MSFPYRANPLHGAALLRQQQMQARVLILCFMGQLLFYSGQNESQFTGARPPLCQTTPAFREIPAVLVFNTAST